MNKKGKEVARRMHGCALAGRWNGRGLPPVIKTVPNRGAPALERSHGFHGKIMPGVVLGPRCNHDIRNLLHLPVLNEETQQLLEQRCKQTDDIHDDASVVGAVDAHTQHVHTNPFGSGQESSEAMPLTPYPVDRE